jgi:hypothetical protein
LQATARGWQKCPAPAISRVTTRKNSSALMDNIASSVNKIQGFGATIQGLGEAVKLSDKCFEVTSNLNAKAINPFGGTNIMKNWVVYRPLMPQGILITL